ncbi:PadR family transcriptional regulator [Pengzhenrongella sp.]|jgi:DNA-binding PadR family transcriptional regulator|uniref:PadR family transcriptional regulator n=1 Tax=Pengzhenrongella sp. TaxID=2888820 RepID=UPI002F93A833
MSLRHAVLGFLSLRPLSGYDLKKYFDASVRHFWTADQAQIYRALGQLAGDGLVEVDVVAQDGRPDRKEHHITSAGLAALDDWLRAPLEPHTAREPFLVKVFFAARLSVAETRAIIDARIVAAQAQLKVLRAFADDATAALTGPPGIERLLTTATLENGIRHVVTELDWLRDLRRGLEDLPPGAQRGRERLESELSAPSHEGDPS